MSGSDVGDPRGGTGARPRRGLDRDRIVRAAVAMADADGLDALSMRRLADRLEAAPMALYRHVANKDDLLDGMVEVVYGEVDTVTGAGWRATLGDRARSMRTALLRHPWAVGRMESRSPGPANLRYHDAGMACLREDVGLPIRVAIDAYSLLDSFVYGFALQEQTLPGDVAAEAGARRDALEASDPTAASSFPHLIEVVQELGAAGYDHGEQFERGLAVVLDGIDGLRRSCT